MSSDGVGALIQVIRRADKDKPTKEDKAELDRILREHPALWRAAGDIMEQAGRKLAADMSATYAVKRSVTAGWEQLQKDLARPGDEELERLLVQQAALAWLKLAVTEYQHAHFLISGGETITKCDFWERRLSAAQRRYLRACETLARVRRLRLPAVQVNIGAQQVNQVNAM
ncbi:MAG: hypothetical protein H3C69_08950 [Candidatus Promineofilum sp.]|nr:hypothetical protein [Promineifilum sp.]